MKVEWHTALLLTLVAPILPIAGLLLRRSTERRASFALAGWLTAFVLLATPSIIGFMGAYQRFPWLTFAPFDTELWLGPLIFLYTLTLTRAVLPANWWLWLLPGVVQTLYYTACFVLLGNAEAKFAYARTIHQPFVVPVESLLAVTLAIVGVALSWRETNRYRTWLQRSYSSVTPFDLSALRGFLSAMVALVSVWAGLEALQTALGRLSYLHTTFVFIGVGAAVLLLALNALTQVHRSYPKMPPPPRPDLPTAPAAAPAVSLAALHKQVQTGGWHRDPGLTVRELARQLGSNESALSARVNAAPDVNFNQFINRIRLEEVCAALLDEGDDRTVLEIALDCGFGSKATFNRTFKEHVGMTPGQWKKQGKTSQITELLGFS
ncbi:MAG: helix-turn-helix domain-containing protein [Pseudomonadota bacterium]